MNCRPGDLAVFVRSCAGNEGKIVRCLRLATDDELRAAAWVRSMGPVWFTDTTIISTYGEWVTLATDAHLRPIRPSEGPDETLAWKEVPSGVTA